MIFQLIVVACLTLATPATRVITLQDAIATAETHQPQLRIVQAQTRAAEAQGRQARAALLPQLTAVVGYQRTTANYVLRPGYVSTTTSAASLPQPTNTSYNYYSGSLTLNQLLFDFGQSLNRWRSSEQLALSQEDTERASVLMVLLNVRTAYFQARATKALVQVALDNLANLGKHVTEAKNWVQVGTHAEIDLVQARSSEATGRVTLITAQNNYEVAKAQLNQAMGIEDDTHYDVGDETLENVPGEEADTDTLMQEVIQIRPEYAAIAAQVSSQEALVRSLYGTYFPSVGATLSLTDAGITANSLVWNWSAGATLTWPLLAGGLNVAQIEAAEATLAQYQAQLDLERQSLRFEVEQARLGVRAAKENVTAADRALGYSKELLGQAESRYEVGAGSIIELDDAQVTYIQSAGQAVQAEYSLSTARATLVKALGRAS